jgi:hypothetical protein
VDAAGSAAAADPDPTAGPIATAAQAAAASPEKISVVRFT